MKYGILSKYLPQNSNNVAVEKNLRVMIKFFEKRCLPVITCNKKRLAKQVIPVPYILGKTFFAAAIFESL